MIAGTFTGCGGGGKEESASDVIKITNVSYDPTRELYEEYNKELKARSLMDYDDQMVYAYRMLKSSPDLLKFYQDKYNLYHMIPCQNFHF